MADKSPNELPRHDEANWAGPITSLLVNHVPTGSLNLNVDGRQVVGPLQGFGKLWQKTFRLSLAGTDLTHIEIMQIWKANFPHFQPAHNRFFPVSAIEPGQIVLINASATGMPLSTGVVVLYADEESFTLMTPQGHPESGWVTFSTFSEDECVVCQVQTISRANDPLYEVGFRLFASRTQDRIWTHVLEALAAYVRAQKPNVPEPEEKQANTNGSMAGQVMVTKVCLDPRVQWSEARNIWQNAALHTLLYTLAAPLRWLRRRFKRRQTNTPQ